MVHSNPTDLNSIKLGKPPRISNSFSSNTSMASHRDYPKYCTKAARYVPVKLTSTIKNTKILSDEGKLGWRIEY